MLKIKDIEKFFKNLEEDHISEYTAQCAYYTILSFIPFIILVLTLIKYIGIEKDTLLYIINQTIPEYMINDSILGIVEEVNSKTVGTLTISLIFVLWSAGKGFFALCKGLYSIYENTNNYNLILFRIKTTLYTMLFIILLILVLIIMVFGNSINDILQNNFKFFSDIINNILKLKSITTAIILFFAFLILYKFVLKSKYKIKELLPGALFAAITCDTVSFFFSIYIDVFKGFSVMYGSLTTIVLIMMWVYAFMYIILIGAEINKFISQY